MRHGYHCPCAMCANRRNVERLELCWRLDPPAPVITIDPPKPISEPAPAPPSPLITGLVFVALAVAWFAVMIPLAIVKARP